MPMLFRICLTGLPGKWVVLVGEQRYGEYLNKYEAVTDAIEAAADAREAGCAAEVWQAAFTRRLMAFGVLFQRRWVPLKILGSAEAIVPNHGAAGLFSIVAIPSGKRALLLRPPATPPSGPG